MREFLGTNENKCGFVFARNLITQVAAAFVGDY